MDMKDFITGLALMFMFIAGSSIMLISFQADYAGLGASNLTKFNDTYNKMGNITDDVDEISDIISKEKMSPTDYLGYITIPFRSMQIVMKSIGMTMTMIGDYSHAIGIPGWFTVGVGLLLLVSVIFAILGALIKRGGSL